MGALKIVPQTDNNGESWQSRAAKRGNMKKWAIYFKKSISSLSLFDVIDFYFPPTVLIDSRGILPEITNAYWVSHFGNEKFIWADEWNEVPLSEVKLILRDLEDIKYEEYVLFKEIAFGMYNKRKYIGNPDGFAFLIKNKFDIFNLIPRGLAITEQQAQIIILSKSSKTGIPKKLPQTPSV